MMTEFDKLLVSVIGAPGRWQILLEVNGKEWKRYGPWVDRFEAELYAHEALRVAGKIAEALWRDEK